jgi:Zn-dependent protease
MIQSFGLTYIVVSIVSILISLVLHEFMHAYAGYLLGDYTAKAEGRLSLNPIDHVDPFMTIVLPIVTLILFHAPILAAKPVPFNPAQVKYDEYGVLNIALFVFNLIPIPPLDGSRILYAFAPEPLQELMEQIEPYGFFIIFGLVLTGVLSGLIIGLNDFMLHLPVLRALQFSLF